MNNIHWDNLFNTLGENIAKLANETINSYATSAIEDAQAFLDETRTAIKEWTILYGQGHISKEDFKDLLLGQKDLMKMNALKQAGMAQITIDKFRNDLVETLVNTISGAIF